MASSDVVFWYRYSRLPTLATSPRAHVRSPEKAISAAQTAKEEEEEERGAED